MKISIITTVYKAENDLPRLLDSMMAQKSQELEFFLIDNGSPDNCGNICADYAKKDSRFKILTLDENVGYIKARNIGIQQVQADYIGFCDSDDFLEPGGYDRAIELIKKSSCDLFISSWNTVLGKSVKKNQLPYKNGVYRDQQITDIILPNAFGPVDGKGQLHGFAWKMIYKLECIKSKEITFVEALMPVEDQIFNIDVLRNCRTVYVDNHPIYNYVVNEKSITMKNVKLFDAKKSWGQIKLLYMYKKSRVSSEKELEASCNGTASSTYAFFLNAVKSNKNVIHASRVVLRTIDKNMLTEVRNHYSIRDKRITLTIDGLHYGYQWAVALIMKLLLVFRGY